MKRIRLPGWAERQAAGFAAVALVFSALTAALAPFPSQQRLLAFALAYLLVTLVASALWGYMVGVVAAIVADLIVNFFFVPPIHTFTVQAPENIAALFVFLAVALVGASMLALLRRQAQLAEAHEAETALLLDLTQQVAHAVTPQEALDGLCRSVVRALHVRSCSILRREGSTWSIAASTGKPELTTNERAMANEALRTDGIVRYGAAAVARTRVNRAEPLGGLTFVPLARGGQVEGVLRIAGELHPPRRIDVERLLKAFAAESATAVERAALVETARRVETLQRADEFKTAILSSVSHDLRSPLTAIKAAVGTLRDPAIEWTAEDRAVLLETIETQTDRLTSTVAGLLEMSRLEGGVIEPHFESLNVADLLADSASATRASVDGRVLEQHVADEPWVRGDYALLLQALINLIENAAKYSLPGKPIHLSAERSNSSVVIEVRDEGPGIAPEDLPHIFEKFYRGAGSKAAKGSGLGLSIVEAMVRLSGGRIEVSSSPSGTRFAIELPATDRST